MISLVRLMEELFSDWFTIYMRKLKLWEVKWLLQNHMVTSRKLVQSLFEPQQHCSLHHAILRWSSIHVYYQKCWGQHKESCVLMDNRYQIEDLEFILIKAGSWIYSPSRMFTLVKRAKWRTFHLTSLPNLWFLSHHVMNYKLMLASTLENDQILC